MTPAIRGVDECFMPTTTKKGDVIAEALAHRSRQKTAIPWRPCCTATPAPNDIATAGWFKGGEDE